MSRAHSDPPATHPETAADLRRRARRVRGLVADVGNDMEARERLAELARELDARAEQLETTPPVSPASRTDA